MAERQSDLAGTLDGVLRFGALMLRAGDTAFRVRDSMGLLAASLGIEEIAVQLSIGGLTATARRGGDTVTRSREIAPPGIDAQRIVALDRLARSSQPGLTAQRLAADLDAIEAAPPHYRVLAVTAAVGRLAYAAMIILSAAIGLSTVAALAGLTVAPDSSFVRAIDSVAVGWRALASFAGGVAFAVLYNSPLRTLLAVGIMSLLGNELRLTLHDLGMALPTATFFGALTVGLLASLARHHLQQPRIVLTVPSIIIMTPGLYGFQAIVMLNQGDVMTAIRAGADCCFIVGAMAVGLVAARFLTERRWLFER